MADRYEEFRSEMIALLRDSRYIDILNFQLRSNEGPNIHIYPNAYRGVADAIERGIITIVCIDYFDDEFVQAGYINGLNAFIFKRSDVNEQKVQRALIIHEATHAAIDREGIGIHNAYLNEAAAYIAQAAVVLHNIHTHTQRRRANEYLREDSIRRQALRYAVRLVRRNPTFNFDAVELEPLLRVLRRYYKYDSYESDTFFSRIMTQRVRELSLDLIRQRGHI